MGHLPACQSQVWRQLPFDEKRVHCERRSRGHQGPPGVTRGHQGSLQLSHVTARHSASQHRLKEEGNVLFKLPDSSERHRETA